MRSFIQVFLILLLPLLVKAQISPLFLEPTKKEADSLLASLNQNINDTLKMAAYRDLALYYLDTNSDSALYFITKELPLTKKLKQRLWEADGLDLFGMISLRQQKYDQSEKIFKRALAIVQDKASEKNIWHISNFTNSNSPKLARLTVNAAILNDMTSVFYETDNQKMELSTIRQCLEIAASINDFTILSLANYHLGDINFRKNKINSALIYFKKSLAYAEKSGYRKYLSSTFGYLGDVYIRKKMYGQAKLNYTQGLFYTKDKNDSLFFKRDIDVAEQLYLKVLEKENLQSKSRLRTYGFLTGLGIFLLVALLLYRNNLQKQKVNIILEKTLSDLKATQTQLIQSEKMASLGELTAGIAHEIQNPLNFVNNFSEVSNELIQEIKDERAKNNDDRDEALLDEILNDISKNLEKISHHGKRADAIVKGMLQHSRSSSGTKEPTDINALADEYLRLSYHGLRAKDKSFNATMITHYDPDLAKVALTPQDIGRVLLNLFTNAFYSVDEKKEQGAPGYVPTVTVSTGKKGSNVQISVRDNGAGIPQSVIDKIMQPFFTTKPTGKGTGLGLSMSFDIIKAHGGEIKVESVEGEFAEFIVLLPFDLNSK